LLKGYVLFLIGAIFIVISLGLSLAILNLWVFSGFPKYSYVSLESVNVVMWLNIMCVIVGMIGGYLVGRYFGEFRLFMKSD
jgi:hypothetical protein